MMADEAKKDKKALKDEGFMFKKEEKKMVQKDEPKKEIAHRYKKFLKKG